VVENDHELDPKIGMDQSSKFFSDPFHCHLCPGRICFSKKITCYTCQNKKTGAKDNIIFQGFYSVHLVDSVIVTYFAGK